MCFNFTWFQFVIIFWYLRFLVLGVTETVMLNDAFLSPLLRKPCTLKGNLTNHAHCGSYFTCGNNEQWQLHYCTYPQLFSNTSTTCLPYDQVTCGSRFEPVTPCGYREENCRNKEEQCICQGRQDLNYNFCKNKSDGRYSVKSRLSPIYMKCDKQRTILNRCDDLSLVFDEKKGTCVTIFVAAFPEILWSSFGLSNPSSTSSLINIKTYPVNMESSHFAPLAYSDVSLTTTGKPQNVYSDIHTGFHSEIEGIDLLYYSLLSSKKFEQVYRSSQATPLRHGSAQIYTSSQTTPSSHDITKIYTSSQTTPSSHDITQSYTSSQTTPSSHDITQIYTSSQTTPSSHDITQIYTSSQTTPSRYDITQIYTSSQTTPSRHDITQIYTSSQTTPSSHDITQIYTSSQTTPSSHDITQIYTSSQTTPSRHDITQIYTSSQTTPSSHDITQIYTSSQTTPSSHDITQIYTSSQTTPSSHDIIQIYTSSQTTPSSHDITQIYTSSQTTPSSHDMTQIYTSSQATPSSHDMTQIYTSSQATPSRYDIAQIYTSSQTTPSSHDITQVYTSSQRMPSRHDMTQIYTSSQATPSSHDMTQIYTSSQATPSSHNMTQIYTSSQATPSRYDIAQIYTSSQTTPSSHDITQVYTSSQRMPSRHDMTQIYTSSQATPSSHDMTQIYTSSQATPSSHDMTQIYTSKQATPSRYTDITDMVTASMSVVDPAYNTKSSESTDHWNFYLDATEVIDTDQFTQTSVPNSNSASETFAETKPFIGPSVWPPDETNQNLKHITILSETSEYVDTNQTLTATDTHQGISNKYNVYSLTQSFSQNNFHSSKDYLPSLSLIPTKMLAGITLPHVNHYLSVQAENVISQTSVLTTESRSLEHLSSYNSKTLQRHEPHEDILSSQNVLYWLTVPSDDSETKLTFDAENHKTLFSSMEFGSMNLDKESDTTTYHPTIFQTLSVETYHTMSSLVDLDRGPIVTPLVNDRHSSSDTESYLDSFSLTEEMLINPTRTSSSRDEIVDSTVQEKTLQHPLKDFEPNTVQPSRTSLIVSGNLISLSKSIEHISTHVNRAEMTFFQKFETPNFSENNEPTKSLNQMQNFQLDTSANSSWSYESILNYMSKYNTKEELHPEWISSQIDGTANANRYKQHESSTDTFVAYSASTYESQTTKLNSDYSTNSLMFADNNVNFGDSIEPRPRDLNSNLYISKFEIASEDQEHSALKTRRNDPTYSSIQISGGVGFLALDSMVYSHSTVIAGRLVEDMSLFSRQLPSETENTDMLESIRQYTAAFSISSDREYTDIRENIRQSKATLREQLSSEIENTDIHESIRQSNTLLNEQLSSETENNNTHESIGPSSTAFRRSSGTESTKVFENVGQSAATLSRQLSSETEYTQSIRQFTATLSRQLSSETEYTESVTQSTATLSRQLSSETVYTKGITQSTSTFSRSSETENTNMQESIGQSSSALYIDNLLLANSVSNFANADSYEQFLTSDVYETMEFQSVMLLQSLFSRYNKNNFTISDASMTTSSYSNSKVLSETGISHLKSAFNSHVMKTSSLGNAPLYLNFTSLSTLPFDGGRSNVYVPHTPATFSLHTTPNYLRTSADFLLVNSNIKSTSSSFVTPNIPLSKLLPIPSLMPQTTNRSYTESKLHQSRLWQEKTDGTNEIKSTGSETDSKVDWLYPETWTRFKFSTTAMYAKTTASVVIGTNKTEWSGMHTAAIVLGSAVGAIALCIFVGFIIHEVRQKVK